MVHLGAPRGSDDIGSLHKRTYIEYVLPIPTVTGFDWDEGNRQKCQKHGVSMMEIEQVFYSNPLVFPVRRENEETRFNAVGLTLAQRHVFVVYTLRDSAEAKLIRPISARYMHRKEVDMYERTREA